jgi:glutamine synthetase
LIEKDVKKDEAIFQVIRDYIIFSKNVRFEGNSYSEDWIAEAVKHGLTNVTDVVEILEAYLSKSAKTLFNRMNIFTEKELEARTEVRLDNFTKKIQIESRVIGDMALNQIVPTAINYQTSLIENVRGLKELFSEKEFKELAGTRLELIKKISDHVTNIKTKVNEMVEARKQANAIESPREKTKAYTDIVLPYIEDIRYHIDKLELIVDNEIWPLPKYRELLFSH